MITLVREQQSLPCLQAENLQAAPLWVRYEPDSGDVSLMLDDGNALTVATPNDKTHTKDMLNGTHNIVVMQTKNGRLIYSLECRIRRFTTDGRELVS